MEKVVIPLTSMLAVWGYLTKWYFTVKPYLVMVVEKAEQRAKDGLIDKADRKAIAMEMVEELQKEGKVKLNFINRIILSRVINHLAEKLPDFTIK